MRANTIHIEFLRRISAFHLFTGLLTITCTAVGVLAMMQSLSASSAQERHLLRLAMIAEAIRADFSSNGGTNVQSLVERFRPEALLTYCTIVSDDGHYLAHSSPELVGQICNEPTGEVAAWGDVQRVRFVGPESRTLLEYRFPLKRVDQTSVMLRMAVPQKTLWQTLRSTTSYVPLVLLGPLLLVLIGACVLRNMMNPVAYIETQLRSAAAATESSKLELHPVESHKQVAVGWNRFVDQHSCGNQRMDLKEPLIQGLEEYRHRKAEQIFNSLPDGIAVTNQQGQITFSNRALATLFGTADESLCGKSIEECLALQSADDQASGLLNVGANARSVVAELGDQDDPSQPTLRVARHPVRNQNGSLIGHHVWSVRDVTQQKLGEKMRSEFVDSVSHELRTPLTNIKAYAETLALNESLDINKQKQFCNTINSEATRLSRLIDDLLSISRMESGAMSLDRRETDLERLLQLTIENVRSQMDQKQITFVTHLPEKMPEVNVDKDKFAIVLVNLLGNAAKYTPEGGRISLGVEVNEEQIHINVADTGIGITADELPKIFDKFFRSADPRVYELSGTGLGLSIAYEIVRLHGGKMTVQSELDKGTTFSVILPMRREGDVRY